MLQIKNLTKAFAGYFLPLLNGIDLTLEEGDFCVVLGSNGSGKSTFLRSIAGEIAIDAGSILINGVDMTHADKSKLIASVVQDSNQGTIAQMTLFENMVLSLLRGKSGKFALYRSYEQEVLAYLQDFTIDLRSYLHQPLSNLSGGQRQMVATLMAIVSQPKILLLDEHTSALDPAAQKILMDYTTAAISKHKITSIMITHKLDDAIKYGNRLIMLHKGKIVFDVAGQQKKELTSTQLLQLFHGYEDRELVA